MTTSGSGNEYAGRFTVALAGTLRAERARTRMTYDELMARTGISKSSLIMYEQGKRDPNVNTLSRIAAALGVKTSYLTSEAERRMDEQA